MAILERYGGRRDLTLPVAFDVPGRAVWERGDRAEARRTVGFDAVELGRGETFRLTTLNVRLLPDGHLAARAYGRPTGGGRGTYVSFSVPDDLELTALISGAATSAGSMWAAHHGLR